MRYTSLGASAVLVAGLALTPLANAQFFDGFETYANNSAIEGQGGWHNWDTCANGNRADNTVTQAQAFAGSQSLRLVGSNDPSCSLCSDTVHDLNGPYTSGQWTLSVQTYIPSSFVGQAYIIGLNEYNDCGGPYNWSMQMHFESQTGMLEVDHFGPNSNTTTINGDQPIIFDQWIEVKAEIDLDLDSAVFLYNCVPMFSYTWSEGISGGGTPTFDTLDLFPGTTDTTEVFLDDISMTAGFTGGCPIGSNYCTANPNATGSPSEISATGSTQVVDNDVVLEVSSVPQNAFAFFLNSQQQGFVMNPGGSAGNLCLGGAIGRFQQQIFNVGASGSGSIMIDLTMIPRPTGAVAIAPGETWFFQAWHRDTAPGGGATSNFSDGIQINFN